MKDIMIKSNEELTSELVVYSKKLDEWMMELYDVPVFDPYDGEIIEERNSRDVSLDICYLLEDINGIVKELNRRMSLT